MSRCAHVVSAETPGISRPARVRFVQRGNRRCDTAPSISCHVPSQRRGTECPSLRPELHSGTVQVSLQRAAYRDTGLFAAGL